MKNRIELAIQHFSGTGAELGVARGDFTVALLDACKIKCLYAIDRWADHHGAAECLAAARRLAHYRRCVPLRMTFAEAAPLLADGSLDFVYIDGYAHTGQERGQTLADWWPKIKTGGVLAGHDYHAKWQPTMDAVDGFCAEHSLRLHVTDSADDGGDEYPSWWVVKGAADFVPQPRWRLAGELAAEMAGRSIVLVGNGPSITRAELGAAIDAHDEVVRFNWYALKGFEKHTGTRTTLWSTFGRGTRPRDPGEVPPRALFIHGDKPKQFHIPVPEAFGIPREFYDGVRDRLRARSRRDETGKKPLLPSSGLVVALWLLERGLAPKISLAGFDHFSKAVTGQHHYWLPQNFKTPPEHDGAAEAEWFEELAAAGRVEYLQ